MTHCSYIADALTARRARIVYMVRTSIRGLSMGITRCVWPYLNFIYDAFGIFDGRLPGKGSKPGADRSKCIAHGPGGAVAWGSYAAAGCSCAWPSRASAVSLRGHSRPFAAVHCGAFGESRTLFRQLELNIPTFHGRGSGKLQTHRLQRRVGLHVGTHPMAARPSHISTLRLHGPPALLYLPRGPAAPTCGQEALSAEWLQRLGRRSEYSARASIKEAQGGQANPPQPLDLFLPARALVASSVFSLPNHRRKSHLQAPLHIFYR